MSNDNTIETHENEAGREASELSAALCPPYSVYEHPGGSYSIVDGENRIVLEDVYAYDLTSDARLARMEALAEKLSGA